MTTRSLRLGAAAAATVAALTLAGCATGGGSSSDPSASDAPGPLVLQSKFSTATETKPYTALVDAFTKKTGIKVTINTVPSDTFRQQLPTYLASSTPPDVLTWFAGAATNAYSKQGLLMDASSVIKPTIDDFSPGIQKLITAQDGKMYFVPMNYYWWGVYYRKSVFDKLGLTPPTTWDDMIADAKKAQSAGLNGFENGLSDTAWMASSWFDYLDIRLNGAEYHVDLLAGKHKFTDDKVTKVFEKLSEVVPLANKDALGTTFQQSVADFAAGKSAMYLNNAFLPGQVPADVASDLGFFSFATIDSQVPTAQEAPTDGFFASAKATHPNAAKKFLEFAASPEGQDVFMANGGAGLPANTKAKMPTDAATQQGAKLLQEAAALTQFFNRDATDAVQPTADAALTKFWANPAADPKPIQAEWQAAAEQARANAG